ncbi:hypothetical protein FB561_1958 [Kribbella amoyensis]|uniref:SH3 domain-containing protein n=1 Tax=Kribbella amoyensis TaxID=996641 RepID=A0A561BPR8_9ACTN|nr:hypothetical protein [Kribbella amoyensis]TWD80861.1 hypothetical protein FB561_1958 [Kribbella amoyensis]
MRKSVGAAAMAAAAMGSLVFSAGPSAAQTTGVDRVGEYLASTLPAGPPEARAVTANGDVKCTRSDVSNSWVTWCNRKPVDGDDGGVSGFANVHNTRVSGYADLEFTALGEKINLRASSGLVTHFGVYVWRGSKWQTVFRHTEYDGHISKKLERDCPEFS